MGKKQTVLFFSLFLFVFSLNLSGRSREDFIKLHQQATMPPLEKKKLYRKKYLPNAPLELLEQEDPANYLFSIKTKKNFKNCSWRVYHQGHIVPEKEGVFQFIAARNKPKFTLVVGLIEPPTQNAVEDLFVPEGVSYILCTLTKVKDLVTPGRLRWMMEVSLGDEGLTVPQDALIVVLDPEHVEKIEPHTWKRSEEIIMLPTLVLNNTFSLTNASTKALLGALDIDTFHGRTEIEKTKFGEVHISRIARS